MNFQDSPAEAEFRQRIRAWLAESGDTVKRSHSDDAYWTSLGDWHRTLYDAGFFALSWPKKYGGRELPPVCEVIVDEELANAGAPPKPSLGYLIQGISHHGSEAIKDRFLPGLINGRDRWCQGFSEPDAGSDLASLRTTAVLDGDEYIINGHKIWTSYSDVAEWCIVLARTNSDVAKHKGLSAFAVPMATPGIEQRPLRMINGISTEFGQVIFDDVRVPAANMIGEPGEGWPLAMTIVSHEREPAELGFFARYAKTVSELEDVARADAANVPAHKAEQLAWAYVESEMLRIHTARRLSERFDGVVHGSDGSIDKLLMTWVEQSVGHAALSFGGADAINGGSGEFLDNYLYSRAQSVMGGTSQIQKNIIATRILGLPTK
jgi:alkylation response protein AidB-like acyl-CoA dehydrogenase